MKSKLSKYQIVTIMAKLRDLTLPHSSLVPTYNVVRLHKEAPTDTTCKLEISFPLSKCVGESHPCTSKDPVKDWNGHNGLETTGSREHQSEPRVKKNLTNFTRAPLTNTQVINQQHVCSKTLPSTGRIACLPLTNYSCSWREEILNVSLKAKSSKSTNDNDSCGR